MTIEEMQARAIQRAKTEHVHIFKTDRPNVYTTRSKSDPRQRYTLVVGTGIVACSCKGYEHRKCCKHSEQLVSRLARERVAARRQRPANVSDLYGDAA